MQSLGIHRLQHIINYQASLWKGRVHYTVDVQKVVMAARGRGSLSGVEMRLFRQYCLLEIPEWLSLEMQEFLVVDFLVKHIV